MNSSAAFDIGVSRSSAWIFNCYLVDAGSALVVIDPGLPLLACRTIDMSEQHLDRTLDDVAAINCPHAHPDQVARVTTITERAVCDVHLPQRCKNYLEGERPRTFPGLKSTVDPHRRCPLREPSPVSDPL